MKGIVKSRVDTTLPDDIYSEIAILAASVQLGKTAFVRLCIHFAEENNLLFISNREGNFFEKDFKEQQHEQAKTELKQLDRNNKSLAICISKELRAKIKYNAENLKLSKSAVVRLSVLRALMRKQELFDFVPYLRKMDSVTFTTDKEKLASLWTNNEIVE